MKRFLALLLILIPGLASAANFTAANSACTAEHLSLAEQWRTDLAVFWTGKPLPGNWHQPCPINVKHDQGAGGATSFAFDRGEVFGWRMMVQGPRELILNSVIPHEVNHTIFATLTRRPIPRWLDEGCCTLFEHPTEQARIRVAGLQGLDSQYNAWQRFDSGDYPPKDNNGYHVMALYGTGFTTVEWLIEQKGVETLWRFIEDRRLPSAKFTEYYGMSVSDGWKQWRVWARGRDANTMSPLEQQAVADVRHYQPVSESKPTLFVVSTDEFFCPPCHRFKVTDYGGDANFRSQLDRSYNVEFVFKRNRPDLVQKYGITGVPAFCLSTSNQCITGYQGKEALLSQLSAMTPNGQRSAPTPIAAAPRTNPQPTLPVDRFQPPTVATPRVASQGYTNCQCRENFAALHARIAVLEGQLANVQARAGEPGRDGRDGKDGRGMTGIRLNGSAMEVQFSDSDHWVSLGEITPPAADLKQQVQVQDADGRVIDDDTYTIGKQPIVIRMGRSSSAAAIRQRLDALEPLLPLLRRRVQVFVGDEMVDELAGDEALRPEDPIPIYLVPRVMGGESK